MKYDKWEELKIWLKDGTNYERLPLDQRKAYQRALEKMDEIEEIEKRFISQV